MKDKGIALVISGPSGAGKGTLVKMLTQEFPNITFSVSYTTRSPRRGEKQGIDYFFVDKERFKELVERDFFAEWAQVHGNFYGTPKIEIEQRLDKGLDVIFDIDVQGARKLKQNLKDGVFVFIMPPGIEELRDRLEKRGTDSKEVVEKRLKNAKKEIDAAREFDFIVVNDILSEAYERLRCIYIAQKSRVYPDR